MKPQRKPKDPKDYGTPEARKKRIALVVNQNTGQAGDPDLSFCELGRLCETGVLHHDRGISRRMYDAGMMLRGLWRAVHPQAGSCTLGRFQPRESSTGEGADKAEADLRSLRDFFGPTRSMTFTACVNCAVYDMPQFGGKLQKLRRGLHLIIEWQKQK